MVNRAFGHSNIHTAPARRKPSRGLLFNGDFSGFLGLEKIPQPGNFKNMDR
jgi:hypothetical protein